MTIREWSLLLTIATLWGGAFFFVAVAVKEIPPLTLNALRLLLGGAILFSVLRMTGGRLALTATRVKWILIVAVVNSLAPLYLHSWAQQYITGGLTSIINAMVPLTTLFVAHFLTDEEKFNARRLAGSLIGFAGIAVMIGMDALKSIDTAVVAQFASVLATIFFAFGTVFARRFHHIGMPPLAATACVLLASGTMFLVLAVFIDRPWTLPAPSLAAISTTVAAGFLSTAAAQFLFFRLITTAGANNVSLVALLSPVSAILLGALIIGEVVEWRHLAGMATVAAGLVIVDGRLLFWLRARFNAPAH